MLNFIGKENRVVHLPRLTSSLRPSNTSHDYHSHMNDSDHRVRTVLSPEKAREPHKVPSMEKDGESAIRLLTLFENLHKSGDKCPSAMHTFLTDCETSYDPPNNRCESGTEVLYTV